MSEFLKEIKQVFLFFSILFLLGCQSEEVKQSISESDAEIASDSSAQSAADTTVKSFEREFPRLTSKNAEAFLRSYFKENSERKIKLTTRLGVLKFRLYDDTPVHSANFLMLVKREYFNDTEFTRVVENFVVQGGNNDKEQEDIKRLLIGSYELEPEFNQQHLHKKGALAMARRYEENPDKRSSGYNFYFVKGQKFTEPQLLAIERDNEMQIPEWKRQVYRTLGGAPHLDGEHTVFGEIYEGLDVLEKMSLVETDASDWPLKPLIMKMEVIED
ncbi:peptidylprolyl isomerase [Cryomorpha ignava]|uniref:peptidylprolyl isomerase n=1 Tax=Cryomorpha ignava TaxID=101383 RepID=A0A7K3WLH9_9FLAO|nr:peptidylprolyl isomerase [Cryomorpha ignava]NEN22497.1 peptidylprolyl isomerase [Cryomorpha ignava]